MGFCLFFVAIIEYKLNILLFKSINDMFSFYELFLYSNVIEILFLEVQKSKPVSNPQFFDNKLRTRSCVIIPSYC